MSVDQNDVTPERLPLTMHLPDAARREQVRRRCRIELAKRHAAVGRRPSAHRTPLFDSALTYGISIAYLAAMLQDVFRVYWRR